MPVFLEEFFDFFPTSNIIKLLSSGGAAQEFVLLAGLVGTVHAILVKRPEERTAVGALLSDEP